VSGHVKFAVPRFAGDSLNKIKKQGISPNAACWDSVISALFSSSLFLKKEISAFYMK
jgi:hypothetical protein